MTSNKSKEKKSSGSRRKSSTVQTGNSKWMWPGLILVLTFIAFYPSLNCLFTEWDDHLYVTESELIKNLSLENITRIFSTESVVALNYHPLTIISLAIDYHFSKLDPFHYHLMNLIFHLMNTLLVFIFVNKISGGKLFIASFVSLFFGIHPMHVESVTWISERKDVLYVFFFLLALNTYLNFLKSGKATTLLLTFTLFLLSVLSKGMAVVFPVILLLVDYYKEEKISPWLFIEKIPFLIVSIIFGILALRVQSGEAIATYETFSLFERIQFGFYGFFEYILKLIVPVNLSAFYPYPNSNMDAAYPLSFYLVSVAGIILFTTIVILAFRKKYLSREFLFGIGFYLTAVVLVLQFISVGGVIMADRYSYLSYIGLLFPIGAGLNRLIEQKPNVKSGIYWAVGMVAITFMVITQQRTRVWKDAETLWTDVIKKYPLPYWRLELPYEGRAKFYAVKKNEPEKALADYETLLSMRTKNPTTYNNLGNIYGSKGLEAQNSGDSLKAMESFGKSVGYFTASLSFDSTVATTYTNRGLVYLYMKKYPESAADYEKALRLDPENLQFLEFRAYVYYLAGRYEESIFDYDKLIALNPEKTLLYYYRGIVFMKSRRAAEGLSDLRHVIEKEPNNAAAYYYLSLVENLSGDISAALVHANKAMELGYRLPAGYVESLRLQAR